jgi:hypothetical protein
MMPAASFDDGSVLRRRQRPSTTAAYYDDGSVVRRWQAMAGTRHNKGDCGSTKATAVCVDSRQRRIIRGQRHRPYCRKTTAAAEIDDDAIGGSISLVRGSKQQSTDDRGEESAMTIQQPIGDGGGEIQQSTLILGGRGRWSGLDKVLSLGGGGSSLGTGGVFAGGGGTRELIVT